MPTNLASNFDPSDPDMGGKILPAGTSRQGEVIEIVDEIINVGSASFGRITGSSPTPAGLQDMAGSAAKGNTGWVRDNRSNFSGKFDAFYAKHDPALDSGDTAASFAIVSGRYGHGLCIADPPTTGVADWHTQAHTMALHYDWDHNRFADNHPSELFDDHGYWEDRNDNQPGETFFSRLDSTGSESPGSHNNLQIDHRMFFFIADEYMVWRIVLDAEPQRESATGMIWFKDVPADGHYTRDDVPYASVRGFRRWNTSHCVSCAHGGNGKAKRNRIRPELGFVPNNADTQGREIIGDEFEYGVNPIPVRRGRIPGLKIVRDEAIATWDTVTIDGDNWVCFQRDSGRGYLTRYENTK